MTAIVPAEGILVDQPMSLLNGWTEHYTATYNTALSRDGSEMIPPDDATWVAVGAVDNNTDEIILVAFGQADVVFQETNNNQTNLEHGAYWYRQPGSSMGFAPNASISLGNADTTDYESTERLSLHTLGGSSGGWRAGSRTGIDSSSDVSTQCAFVVSARLDSST